jgi:hypothetical protein
VKKTNKVYAVKRLLVVRKYHVEIRVSLQLEN